MAWANLSLNDRFEYVCQSFPDKTAVSDRNVQLTYRELRRASRHLGSRIAVVAPLGRPVGILLPAGPLFVVSALACLMTGRPYVPIDPAYPHGRNEEVMREAGVCALVVSEGWNDCYEDCTALLDIVPLRIDLSVPDFDVVSSTGAAAILFTSGSSGRPKGICYDQRAIMQRVISATVAKSLSPVDRIALLSSPVTIACLRLTFAAILNGSALYFADPRRLGLNGVLDVLARHLITVTFAVPALLRSLLNIPGADRAFAHVRVVRTGGDVIVRADLDLWRTVLPPSCQVLVSLTSTESPTVFQWIVPRTWRCESARVPVGFACSEVGFRITDEKGVQVSPGEIGELVIESAFLALGYWKAGKVEPFPSDLARTGVRVLRTGDLVRLRSDGLAEMIGRKDRQVKIRGQRIDLGEVEAVLRNCPGVADAAVLAHSEGEEVISLSAYLVADHQQTDETVLHTVKTALHEQLPGHMHPARTRVLDSLPHLPGFKIDFRALRELDAREAATSRLQARTCHPNSPASAGDSSVAAAVQHAWNAILGDNSFETDMAWNDAGGDSLGFIRLWCILEQTLDTQIAMDGLQPSITPVRLIERVERTLLAKRMPCMSDGLNAAPLVFYMPVADGDTLLQAQWRATFGARVRFHVIKYPTWQEMLAGSLDFRKLVDAAVQQITAVTREPANLVGFSFGGFSAWATACQLRELGHEVGFIGLIDARRHEDAKGRRGALNGVRSFACTTFVTPKVAARRIVKNAVWLLINTLPLPLLRSICRFVHRLPAGAASKFDVHFIEQLRLYVRQNWQPRALDIPAHLFRSDEFVENFSDFGWRNVCPQIEVIPVGADHETLLRERHRDILGEKLLNALQSRSDRFPRPNCRAPLIDAHPADRLGGGCPAVQEPPGPAPEQCAQNAP